MKRKNFRNILKHIKNQFENKEPISSFQNYYGEEKVTLIIKTKEIISKEDEKYNHLFELMESSYYLTIKPENEYISFKMKIKLTENVD
ncbi:hypothetical protein [Romboutsia sp.]|uniref:hypothetical protein n=1 Tax=Romboutsia sp. TaxID=1965302 RepID=UPI003F3745F5